MMSPLAGGLHSTIISEGGEGGMSDRDARIERMYRGKQEKIVSQSGHRSHLYINVRYYLFVVKTLLKSY